MATECSRSLYRRHWRLVRHWTGRRISSAPRTSWTASPRDSTSVRGQRSPTGVNPKAKRLKTALVKMKLKELSEDLQQRELCFLSNNLLSELDDEIASLMNIPKETNLLPIGRIFQSEYPTEICGPTPEVIPNIPVRRNRNEIFHLNSDRNFRNLWHSGKHTLFPV